MAESGAALRRSLRQSLIARKRRCAGLCGSGAVTNNAVLFDFAPRGGLVLLLAVPAGGCDLLSARAAESKQRTRIALVEAACGYRSMILMSLFGFDVSLRLAVFGAGKLFSIRATAGVQTRSRRCVGAHPAIGAYCPSKRADWQAHRVPSTLQSGAAPPADIAQGAIRLQRGMTDKYRSRFR